MKRTTTAEKIALAVARELRRNWTHLNNADGPEFPQWDAKKLASHFVPCVERALKRTRKAKK